MSIVLISGALAGFLLFAVQHYTIFPLIEKAETYEEAAPHHHEDEGWRPAEGTERTLYTLATTVVCAIAFAALLFGVAAFAPVPLNWRKGALWGVAAFVCIDLAPSLGLPPQPPGMAVADLYARQLWWIAVVLSTAVALWLLFDRKKALPVRLIGVLLLIVPHIVGPPVAQGESAVPMALARQFALLSILTTGLFWVVLGTIGGLIYARLWNDPEPVIPSDGWLRYRDEHHGEN
jgi:cobalt transporter subunit CbtA